MESHASVPSMEAETELPSDSSPEQDIVEFEREVRDITSLPPYTTITETTDGPWGFDALTFTEAAGRDGRVTVVYAPANTSISTTYYVTTTIPSGQAEYTSTFVPYVTVTVPSGNGETGYTTTHEALDFGVITEIIAVTSAGTTTSASTSPSPTIPVITPNVGVSTGAKIGIGVAVPLFFIFLALALLLFIRKRRRHASEHQEGGDSGLPELMSNTSELKANPHSSQGLPQDELHVEAERLPIHEMNGTTTEKRYEVDGKPQFPPGSELDANPDEKRYEVDGNLNIVTHNELPTEPAPQQPVPSQTAPAPRPETTTFPSPWNSTEAAEYEYPQISSSGVGAMEDPEIVQLEEEAARMKKKRERLQEMQELEEKEEAIRRSILERKKAAGDRS